MARLRCSVEVPGIGVEQLIDAVPLLIERCRGIGYGPDGVAIVDQRRHPEVRLVDGVGGQEGASYEFAAAVQGAANEPLTEAIDSPEPIRMTVLTDQTDRLRAGFSGTDLDGPDHERTPSTGWAELENPGDPRSLAFQVTVGMPPGTPGLFGHSIELDGTVRLHDLWQLPDPQIRISGSSSAINADGSAQVKRTAGDKWQVDVQLVLHPRGLLTLATAAWPFVKGRAEAALADWIRQTMTETAAGLERELGPVDGPEQVADRVWAAMTQPVTA